MRLELTLTPKDWKYSIPINYNYPLSSAIYNIFKTASHEFSRWLHDKGFVSNDGKPFKLFAFSKLYTLKSNLMNSVISGNGDCILLFSSPIEHELVTNFVNGILDYNELFIGSAGVGTFFKITNEKLYLNHKFINH